MTRMDHGRARAGYHLLDGQDGKGREEWNLDDEDEKART
jgi:hypothetical protein